MAMRSLPYRASAVSRLFTSTLTMAGILPVLLLAKLIGPEHGAVLLRWYLQVGGGVFVKVGQLLSSRLDLLGPAYLRELARLTDRLAPTPFPKIKEIVEHELRRPFAQSYRQFDKQPVASASIAQVHLARLHPGERVAVKIMHPGTEYQFQVDLFLLGVFAGLLSGLGLFGRLDAAGLVREISRSIRRELDFTREALSTQRMHDLLASDPIDHAAPKIYFAHSSRRVMTMEYFQGVWLNELIDAVGTRNLAFLAELRTTMSISPERTARLILRSLAEQIWHPSLCARRSA